MNILHIDHPMDHPDTFKLILDLASWDAMLHLRCTNKSHKYPLDKVMDSRAVILTEIPRNLNTNDGLFRSPYTRCMISAVPTGTGFMLHGISLIGYHGNGNYRAYYASYYKGIHAGLVISIDRNWEDSYCWRRNQKLFYIFQVKNNQVDINFSRYYHKIPQF